MVIINNVILVKSKDSSEFENRLNKTLFDLKMYHHQVEDIKYSTSVTNDDITYTALILYWKRSRG